MSGWGLRYRFADNSMSFFDPALGASVHLWKKPIADGETFTLLIKEDATLEVMRGQKKMDFVNAGKVPIPWATQEMHFAVQFTIPDFLVEIDRGFVASGTTDHGPQSHRQEQGSYAQFSSPVKWAQQKSKLSTSLRSVTFSAASDSNRYRNPDPKRSANSFHWPTKSQYRIMALAPHVPCSTIPHDETQLRNIFDFLDTNNDGRLTRDEFAQFLTATEGFGLPVTRKQLDTALAKYQRAWDDGSVSFDEFALIMLKTAQW
eukprot:TRINITY_DN12926_c0_g1_i2.p1 TRINITY_DN12926_c0_g1~~TRINITY_DN12926_c0_g1_i2.p1  ORF type:complete len:260 (-),score=41.67 TRINITY_DN12926_c0_g1_i2:16-795(-)